MSALGRILRVLPCFREPPHFQRSGDLRFWFSCWVGGLLFQGRSDSATRINEVGDDAFVDVEVAFVFAQVSKLMGFVEDPPDLGTETQGMG